MLYVVGILVVVVGLLVSIGLHELGHLIPAKRFGVKVGQYMIGFGPALWSRVRGGTEYGVRAIPLGGYISMAGMYPPAKAAARRGRAASELYDVVMQDVDLDDDDDRAFYKLPVGKRVVIMLGGPVMNLLLAVVMFTVVYCGFGIPTATTTVGSVSECVISVSEERDACEAGDPLAPAHQAGIQPGDRVISVDGVAIGSWDEIPVIIRSRAGQTLPVVVDRPGVGELKLAVTPMVTERYALDANDDILLDDNGDPVTTDAGFIGIGPATANVPQPVTAVIPAIGESMGEMGKVIVTLPMRLWDVAVSTFGGSERDPNGPIGLVGIGRIAGEISSLASTPVADRVSSLIGLLGGLNLALFMFNLLPFVPLDGGHIVVALWDGVRRGFARLRGRSTPRPVDGGRLLPLTLAISGFFILSTALLLIADIVNPISILG